MAVEEVTGDALGDDLVVGLEGIEVAVAHLGGDFEADVEELADVGVVAGVALVVREGADVLLGGPAVDFLGAWELGVVDVDDGGIGLAESFFFLKGLGVDFLGEVESVSTGGGKADDFFEPVGASGLDVEAGAGAGDGFLNRLVDGEFIRTGVDGELEGLGEAVGFDGVSEDGEVVVELLLELGDVADVVDSFVETSGEFRRDGLDGNSLVGDGGEDDEHLGGDLWVVGLVHGDLGDEVVGATLGGDDVVVDGFGLLGRFEELVRGLLDELAGDFEGGVNAFDVYGADELGVVCDEGFDVGRVGGFADVVGDVEGEEVTRGDKAVDSGEVDVVSIKEVFTFPAEVGDGFVGGIAGGLRLGADDFVLAVGLVPGGADVDAEFFGRDEGLELSVCAVGEAIANTEGEFGTGFHRCGLCVGCIGICVTGQPLGALGGGERFGEGQAAGWDDGLEMAVVVRRSSGLARLLWGRKTQGCATASLTLG